MLVCPSYCSVCLWARICPSLEVVFIPLAVLSSGRDSPWILRQLAHLLLHRQFVMTGSPSAVVQLLQHQLSGLVDSLWVVAHLFLHGRFSLDVSPLAMVHLLHHMQFGFIDYLLWIIHLESVLADITFSVFRQVSWMVHLLPAVLMRYLSQGEWFSGAGVSSCITQMTECVVTASVFRWFLMDWVLYGRVM